MLLENKYIIHNFKKKKEIFILSFTLLLTN